MLGCCNRAVAMLCDWQSISYYKVHNGFCMPGTFYKHRLWANVSWWEKELLASLAEGCCSIVSAKQDDWGLWPAAWLCDELSSGSSLIDTDSSRRNVHIYIHFVKPDLAAGHARGCSLPLCPSDTQGNSWTFKSSNYFMPLQEGKKIRWYF